jgi:4'-phosphopantetheinyl transferase
MTGQERVEPHMDDRPPLRETDAGRVPIRVWRIGLDRPEPETAGLGAWLADDERARADRFRFDVDRRRFTVGRALLRIVLGRTLGASPADIEFAYGTRGKPALKWPAGSGLEFNLTHSRGMALVATSWGRPLGIDLEFHRPEFDFRGIANRYFTPEEFGQIEAQPPAAQRAAFFRGWTRKEAFLKAKGDGLWLGLDQFEVSIDPAVPARLVRTAWDPDEAGRWSLHDLDVPAGFSAAMAVAGVVAGPFVVETI